MALVQKFARNPAAGYGELLNRHTGAFPLQSMLDGFARPRRRPQYWSPDYWRRLLQYRIHDSPRPATIVFAEIQPIRKPWRRRCPENLTCNVENSATIPKDYFVAASILILRRFKKALRMPRISGAPILAIQDVDRPLPTRIGRNT